MKKIIIPALSVGVALIFYSCETRSYDEIAGPPTYTGSVKGIMTTNCTTCHFDGHDDPDLTNYDNVKANIDNIINEIEVGDMPPSGPLPNSATVLKTLKAWKAAGMPEK